jgi:hypothetical protein
MELFILFLFLFLFLMRNQLKAYLIINDSTFEQEILISETVAIR